MIRTGVMVLCLLVAWPVLAQGDMRSHRDPAGRFAFQYPRKNWHLLPGGGATLVTIAEKNGKAAVHVEYFRLNQPLKAEENYDLIVDIEKSLVLERHPKAADIRGLPLRSVMPGAIAIDFTRPGGESLERVRQFSIVREQDLFRIVCAAQAADFAKFEANFDQIVRSFRIAAPPPS